MEKMKVYRDVKFTPEVISEARRKLIALAGEEKAEGDSLRLSIDMGNGESWRHDNEEEFFADYRKEHSSSFYSFTRWVSSGWWELEVRWYAALRETQVGVRASTRQQIEGIFHVFEDHLGSCALPPVESADEREVVPRVFVGHGRSDQWRDLKDHLRDKHGYEVEAYEIGARAGHAIRDILEEMLTKSAFAILVMTGEDKAENGTLRARQNVVHELGLFQGRLGFSRAIVLLEEGVEEFSNIQGIHQIRYSKGNIKETFGDVVAVLKREFGAKVTGC